MRVIEIRIPDERAMKEVTLVRWLAADGASVTIGDEILKIESEKAVMSLESNASGRLEWVALPGRPVLRGQLIGRIHCS